MYLLEKVLINFSKLKYNYLLKYQKKYWRQTLENEVYLITIDD